MLHIIRKLIEYSLKNVLVRAMFTLTAFEIFLSKGRLVLSPAQRGTGSERVNNQLIKKQSSIKFLGIILDENLSWKEYEHELFYY